MLMVLLLFRICSRRAYLSSTLFLLFSLCRAFVQYVCSNFVRGKGGRLSAGTTSWGSSSVSVKRSCFAFWGRFPGRGVLWNPRCLRSLEVTPQDGRAAQGPLQPCDEHSPWDVVRIISVLLVGSLGWFFASLLRIFCIWGRHGVW